MSTHNICFRGEIRKSHVLGRKKSALSGVMKGYSGLSFFAYRIRAVMFRCALNLLYSAPRNVNHNILLTTEISCVPNAQLQINSYTNCS